MRNRNSQRSPRLAPLQPAVIGWVRPARKRLPSALRLPTRRPFVAPAIDGSLHWWKLTNPTRPGAWRWLWMAPLGARRWRATPFYLAPDSSGSICLWSEYPEMGYESALLLLQEGALRQQADELDRRAAAARRRRAALKIPHPPKSCACCGEKFTPKRTDAKCCSGKCRAKLSRQKPAAVVVG